MYTPIPIVAKYSVEDTTLNTVKLRPDGRSEPATVFIPKDATVSLDLASVHYNRESNRTVAGYKPETSCQLATGKIPMRSSLSASSSLTGPVTGLSHSRLEREHASADVVLLSHPGCFTADRRTCRFLRDGGDCDSHHARLEVQDHSQGRAAIPRLEQRAAAGEAAAGTTHRHRNVRTASVNRTQ